MARGRDGGTRSPSNATGVHPRPKPEPPVVDLFDPRLVTNPFPVMAVLREQGDGVHRSNLGFWIVTRHADVEALNRDPRLGKDLRRWDAYEMVQPFLAHSALERCIQRSIFFLDPPDHTRQRRLAARAFTPRAVDALRPRLHRLAQDLLAALPDEGEIELMMGFAHPFPVRAIVEILGLPSADFPQLMAWSDALAVVVEPMAGRERLDAADAATVELEAYLRDNIRRRRHRTPRSDGRLIDQLIGAEDGGDRLTEDELVSMVVLLLTAGHETTTNLIGNGTLALVENHDQLQRLRRQPELIDTAVEELTRYDPPGNANLRVAQEDLTVGESRIRAGEAMFTWLGAANRDPRVFGHPDRLDLARHPNPHVSFGGGIHHCLGAALARTEARIAFGALVRRWPRLAVERADLRRRNVINIRGLERLPLVVSP
jgi:cytochrome P450